MGSSATKDCERTIGHSARGRTGLLFFARAALLVALLAVPILGTSYAFVSTVSYDIKSAIDEHADLMAYSGTIDLAAAVEAVHRDVVDRAPLRLSRDQERVLALLSQSQHAYRASASASAFWRAWRREWDDARLHPDVAHVRRAFDAFGELGSDVDSDTLLDYDPNFAVQNLASVMLRSSPRFFTAMRGSADAVADAPEERLTARSISAIAATHALESQPRGQIFSDIGLAMSIDPKIDRLIAGSDEAARRETQRFDGRIDRILRTLRRSPEDAALAESDARRAFDAHIALWQATVRATDALVYERRQTAIQKRRSIIAFSLLAVLLGTLALATSIRSMARRDRIELASSKLEGEKLREELRRASAERALRLQAAQFQSVFENADLGIAIFEPTGDLREHNAALERMVGDRMSKLLGMRGAQVMSFENERPPFTVEEMHANADGSPQWLALTFSGVYDDGRCQMVILLGRDVTEEKLFQESLLHAASHDALTHIPNRSAFERELARLCGEDRTSFALLYIDLDRFKPINDRFGHAAGDAVLVATAGRLRSALATDDICVRLGGDEFAAIVRGENDRAGLERIATRIGKELAKPIEYGDNRLEISASIGIADHRSGALCCTNLKHEADAALYVVKQRGGNGYDHRDSSDAASTADSRPLVA